MSENIKVPCDEALSAMPGDTIFFHDPVYGEVGEEVLTAGWQPTPKKGKDWVYETTKGSRISNSIVSKVVKLKAQENPIVNEEVYEQPDFSTSIALPTDDPFGFQNLLRSVDQSKLPSTFKTVIICLVQGDIKNLEVAAFLISDRARQLKELDNANRVTL